MWVSVELFHICRENYSADQHQTFRVSRPIRRSGDVFLGGAVHMARAAGHQWHLCMKVIDAPTGCMLRRRRIKLYGVLGIKGVGGLFLLAAVHELEGATS